MPSKYPDPSEFIGRTYPNTRLVFLRLLPCEGRKSRRVEARCTCPGEPVKTYVLWNIQTGRTRSCGCLSRETASNLLRTHGKSNTVEYAAWVAMRSVHGEAVCAAWQDFNTFLKDVGPKPDGKYVLWSTTGEYRPGDATWIPTREMMLELIGRVVTHDETDYRLQDLLKKSGVSYQLWHRRIHRSPGRWTPYTAAITRPYEEPPWRPTPS